jgi:hypothetical protein
MVSDVTLILASLGAVTGAAVIVRRRLRRARATWPIVAGAGARQLGEALFAVAAQPLPLAGRAWKSLAETLEPHACDRLD